MASPHSRRSSKPPYTYSGMITYALWKSPEKTMTMSDICKTLETMCEFFRGSYIGWKVVVRHFLSRSKHFILQDNPADKKKLWTVDLSLLPSYAFKKQTTKTEKHANFPDNLHEYLGVPEIVLRKSSTPAPSSSQLSFGIDRILNMSPGTTQNDTSFIVHASLPDDIVMEIDYSSSDSLDNSFDSAEQCRGYSDVSSSLDQHEFGHSTLLQPDISISSLHPPCSPVEPELSHDDIFAAVEELNSMLDSEDEFDFAPVPLPSDDVESVNMFDFVSSSDDHSLSALQDISDFVVPSHFSDIFIDDFEPYLRSTCE